MKMYISNLPLMEIDELAVNPQSLQYEEPPIYVDESGFYVVSQRLTPELVKQLLESKIVYSDTTHGELYVSLIQIPGKPILYTPVVSNNYIDPRAHHLMRERLIQADVQGADNLPRSFFYHSGSLNFGLNTEGKIALEQITWQTLHASNDGQLVETTGMLRELIADELFGPKVKVSMELNSDLIY